MSRICARTGIRAPLACRNYSIMKNLLPDREAAVTNHVMARSAIDDRQPIDGNCNDAATLDQDQLPDKPR